MNTDFWKYKNVFVTGHTGFKGAWLCWWLLKLGAKVSGLALPPATDPNLYLSSKLGDEIHSFYGDVTNRYYLEETMSEFAPDIVFHLAAQSLVHDSYQYPTLTYHTNVMGSVNLLECVRKCPSVKMVIVITSDKCYENKDRDLAYKEDATLGGFDPYSSSKACVEILTSAWKRSFFSGENNVAIATVRAGNVIGGGDWATDRLVPDCMKSLVKNQDIQIRNPDAVRSWQHVLEPLSGYLLLAETLWGKTTTSVEPWNFGPKISDVRSVAQIATEIVNLWGSNAKWIMTDSVKRHEAKSLIVDASKARGKLGWNPKLSIIDTLRWTVEWYRSFNNGDNSKSLVLDQIDAYERLEA